MLPANLDLYNLDDCSAKLVLFNYNDFFFSIKRLLFYYDTAVLFMVITLEYGLLLLAGMGKFSYVLSIFTMNLLDFGL